MAGSGEWAASAYGRGYVWRFAVLGVQTISEAIRYTAYVEGMHPREAMTPLRPGASPPNAEARLQRQAALQFLAHMAATPVAAVRVLKNASDAFDLAGEAQVISERRSTKFPGAYQAADGTFVIPATVEDGDAGPAT